MNIVLHQPEIPHNTGAVGRTALVTGSALHLIHPLGFSLDEKNLKRCGLDYWHRLDVREYDSFEDFLQKKPTGDMRFVETSGKRRYTDVGYSKGCFLVFGCETTGLPRYIIERFGEKTVYIPMASGERSLNLSVAVGVVLFEALRQTCFSV